MGPACKRLNVVDLAGSERVKKSGSEGMRFQEATNINRSLLAFGRLGVRNLVKKSRLRTPFSIVFHSKYLKISRISLVLGATCAGTW